MKTNDLPGPFDTDAYALSRRSLLRLGLAAGAVAAASPFMSAVLAAEGGTPTLIRSGSIR